MKNIIVESLKVIKEAYADFYRRRYVIYIDGDEVDLDGSTNLRDAKAELKDLIDEYKDSEEFVIKLITFHITGTSHDDEDIEVYDSDEVYTWIRSESEEIE